MTGPTPPTTGRGTPAAPEARAIDSGLLDALSEAARTGPRGRRNHNFHASESAPCNRLLNAIEPGSYVAPHRHLDPQKGETFVVVRGRLGLVLFDDRGAVALARELSAGGACVGFDVPAGTFHSLIALEPGTVFFEAKAGPYRPLGPDERAPWAPAEDGPDASAYCARLRSLFGAAH